MMASPALEKVDALYIVVNKGEIMDLVRFQNRMRHISEWMSFFIAEKLQAVYVDPWVQDLDSFLDSMPSYEKVASGLYRGLPGVHDLLHEQFLMETKIKPRFENLQRQLHQQGRKACVCRCIFEANDDTDYIGKTNLHIDKLADAVDANFKNPVGLFNLIRLSTSLGLLTEGQDTASIIKIAEFIHTPPDRTPDPTRFWEIQKAIKQKQSEPLPFDIFENEIQSVAWIKSGPVSYNSFVWVAIEKV